MAKTFNDVITILRRIIGENDGNDPDATNDVLLDYVANFYKLILGQDISSFDLYTWFEFDTVVDQDTYTFKDVVQGDHGFTNIMPPVYIIDSQDNDTQMRYFESPESFYRRHPLNNANEDHSRPDDLLFYNNEILIRPKPDAVYTVKIKAYKELFVPSSGGVLDGTQNIDQEYFLRYIAYGTAMDYLADFGLFEILAQVEPVYRRYKSLVMMRTARQATTQRAVPAL